MLYELLFYLVGGTLSGLMAGLLGIGGGLVVVPFLAFALPYAGFPSQTVMHVAVATSLANIVITSMMSMYSHHTRHAVLWPIVYRLLPWLAMGAIAGGLLAIIFPSRWLESIFGVFAFFISYRLLRAHTVQEDHPLPQGPKLWGSVFSIAGFCALLGMGGGSLMVPYLSHYNTPMRQAIGTAAACGFPIALMGLITLMLSNVGLVSVKPYMTGYLYWPAFIVMSIASITFAPLGAKLTHILPVPILRRIFGVFLLIVGASMLYSGV
jgi:uncharacterized membrane protein YfcA